jgi:ribosomal protein S1
VKKGDILKVKVIGIDIDQRRISLGHKQVEDNPWDYLENKYRVGEENTGKIVRIIEKGIIVELTDGVDGFVPVSQLSFAPVRNISEYFKMDDILPLKVVEFDKDAKKIVLSAVEALRGKEAAIIDKYNSQHPVPNADQYPTYEVKPESLQEEIASMESETEAYLKQEVNFYPSVEEAFEDTKTEIIEIKNTEPVKLSDIASKTSIEETEAEVIETEVSESKPKTRAKSKAKSVEAEVIETTAEIEPEVTEIADAEIAETATADTEVEVKKEDAE